MSGSIEREAERLARPLDLSLRALPSFGAQPRVLELWSALLDDALREAGAGARVLFVAHGIPQRNVRRGDPYAREVEHSARQLGERLPSGTEWSLAYQSRVGPVAWTGPYIEEALHEQLARREPLVLMPLSFVSECLETRYDLDEVAASEAERAGVLLRRVPTLDRHPDFAAVLAELVHTGLREEAA
jgi:ferrochelatase